jgi:hypothetical protein
LEFRIELGRKAGNHRLGTGRQRAVEHWSSVITAIQQTVQNLCLIPLAGLAVLVRAQRVSPAPTNQTRRTARRRYRIRLLHTRSITLLCFVIPCRVAPCRLNHCTPFVPAPRHWSQTEIALTGSSEQGARNSIAITSKVRCSYSPRYADLRRSLLSSSCTDVPIPCSTAPFSTT